MEINIERKSSKKLYDTLSWVFDASSKNCSRLSLYNIIHIESEDGVHTVVSSDGRRMHFAAVDDPGLSDGNFSVVKKGGVLIMSPVPDGHDYEFPDWRKVIPSDFVLLDSDFFVPKYDITDCLFLLYRSGLVPAVDFMDGLKGSLWSVKLGGRFHDVLLFSDCVGKRSVLIACRAFDEKEAVLMAEKVTAFHKSRKDVLC
jgi:hypothetical protein